MTCIHEIVGKAAPVGCLPMSHICDIDFEICCEYWLGEPQTTCKYYKEGPHDV